MKAAKYAAAVFSFAQFEQIALAAHGGNDVLRILSLNFLRSRPSARRWYGFRAVRHRGRAGALMNLC
jgi:hypothetical protein